MSKIGTEGFAMTMFRLSSLAALGMALLSGTAQADFVDGGFEDPAPAANTYTDYQANAKFGGVGGTAWTVVGPQAVSVVSNTFSSTGDTFQAHSGSGWLDLTGSADNGMSNAVTQTVATTAGTTYTLSFWIGHYAGGTFAADAPTIIGLSINNSATLINFSNGTNISSGGGVNNWSLQSTTFVASGSSTSFMFINNQRAANRVAGLDDITLAPFAAAVPGPIAGAGIPALAGLAGFLFARRRREA